MSTLEPEPSPSEAPPAGRVEAADALRRLGHALVGHRADAGVVARITDFAIAVLPEVERAPRRTQAERFTGDERFLGAFLSPGSQPVLAEGESMDLFSDSVVSGSANPMGIALRIRREGDEAVARVTLGHAFQGAPGRAHGGIVSAIVDEVMGSVMPILGRVAFTRTLSITYLAPTPMGEEIEFRARLRGRDGRRLHIECEGTHAGARFVECEGLFVEVDLAAFRGAEETGAP